MSTPQVTDNQDRTPDVRDLAPNVDAPLMDNPDAAGHVPPAPSPEPAPAKSERLLSLDAFRGLTIFGMLLVNNIALGSRTPTQLKHAPWNAGVTFADFVFPWFLLIVGVAVPFAWASHQRKTPGYGRWLGKAVGRAVALVLLGCFIDSSIAKQPIFDLDVLQLIGLAYFVGAVLYPLSVGVRVTLAFVFLFAHWGLLHFLPTGMGETGTLRPDQNAISLINESFLKHWHLAGLVSVIPTGALVLLGTAIGDALRAERLAHLHRLLIVLLAGLDLALLGHIWSHSLPYNKAVWTGSYILFAAGCGIILLATFYALLDIVTKNKWGRAWAFPLTVFGANAIAAYVLPITVKLYLLQGWTWPMPDGTHPTLQAALMHASVAHWGAWHGGWTYTLGYIGVTWLVLLWMHRKGLFLRV